MPRAGIGALVATIGALVATIGALWSTPAWAYRPFDGTDADVAQPGEFELELAPAQFYVQSGARYLLAPTAVLNLGFAPRWEAVVDFQDVLGLQEVPGQARVRLVDTDVLAKVLLVRGSLQRGGPWPSVAAEFGPLLPNVNGESGFGALCSLIVSARSKYLTAHANTAVALTRGDLDLSWFEGLIVEGVPEWRLRPVSELFVEHAWGAGVTTLSALVGVVWRAADGLDLDAGVRRARVGSDWATELRLGFTWSVGLWGPGAEDGRGRLGLPSIARAR
ncbi:MAG: hypothetical protein JOZ69_16175 [Myxococcales bacterium]|nr:hypothetical protein [Myxococcales bacterium]